jgi:hypothetical protein
MGLEDEIEDVSSYWITLRKKMELERGSARTHSVEIWLWKRLWTYRTTDYVLTK